MVFVGHGQQTMHEKYAQFKDEVKTEYSSFRDDCNKRYAQFLLTAWDWYDGNVPIPIPKDENPVPPKPYHKGKDRTPIVIHPINVKPIENTPQPKPIGPIKEQSNPDEKYFSFGFYGNTCKVRMPEVANIKVADCSPKSISNGWDKLCSAEMNNALRDCLEMRIRHNLCDWAYLAFLDVLSKNYCSNLNGATLLMAFMFCQSGYQMRLGVDGETLVMLYGSKHQIYDKGYFLLDGLNFYPYGEHSISMSICNAAFDGESPLSLLILSEQKLGGNLSTHREIKSERYADLNVQSCVPENLVKFYNQYPTSALDGNPMTRWAMYANTPLAEKTKTLIYSFIKKSIDGLSAEMAANKLLNWVQTGFVYEYDDKIWGHDRAFFAEESLYYPYCDCEDRAILFSRLVRDFLDLDVALIYYPGHLATAVCFNEEVSGDAISIDNRKFIICDPTYIGAPVGAQMPDLEYNKIQVLVLTR
ncbi:MAG: hypothetical protein HFJ95_00160 [Muribaculaceae bacterium]|nr:hypothetical protein [Muribaculaceae bacterium]